MILMERYDPARHHRRSIRLRGYNYRQPGSYFVTICVQHRECLFGKVLGATVQLSQFGVLVEKQLEHFAAGNEGVAIASYIIMPNHIHFILDILPSDQCNSFQKRATLGQLIQTFKYETTKQINVQRNTPGIKVWQRNYYEHIIRDNSSRQKLQSYIQENPLRWTIDQLHPQNPSKW